MHLWKYFHNLICLTSKIARLMLKAYFLSALFFMFSASIYAQKTYVPDDNFEQCLIDLGYDDVLDDSVTTANISGVTYLFINYKNISDLTGIEDFAALNNLNCSQNQLTTLDISQNTALKTLDCSTNQLTNIDVSNNQALQTFYCSRNPLAGIDVSHNTTLKYFSCQTCQLTEVDISSNTGLISFSCDGNQLTSVDISNNTALTAYSCGSNQLQALT